MVIDNSPSHISNTDSRSDVTRCFPPYINPSSTPAVSLSSQIAMRLFHSLRLILSFPVVILCVSAQPTVRLDNATVMGLNNGNNTQFLGIPFAQPPFVHSLSLCQFIRSRYYLFLFRVGSLRLQLPRPLPSYTGTINATSPGNQCIQKHAPLVALPSNVTPNVTTFLQQISALGAVPQSEDCRYSRPTSQYAVSHPPSSGLNINVIVPTGAKPGDKFPVAAVSAISSHSAFNSPLPMFTRFPRSVDLRRCVSFQPSSTTVKDSEVKQAVMSLGPTPCTSSLQLSC